MADNIKIAVLLNETKGALQQHLQLTSANITTYQQLRTNILEYYQAQASFGRMQQQQQQQAAAAAATASSNQGPAPMDIGAINKGKGKYRGKGKGKSSGKGPSKGYNKGKSSKGYNNYSNYNNYNKGKGKYRPPIGQAMPFKAASKGKGKGKPSKGKGKGSSDQCYKCGQRGHIARDCRVAESTTMPMRIISPSRIHLMIGSTINLMIGGIKTMMNGMIIRDILSITMRSNHNNWHCQHHHNRKEIIPSIRCNLSTSQQSCPSTSWTSD